MKLPKVGIKKILYATDLSEGAKYAFAYAVTLANTLHASITILHVLFEDQSVDSVASFYIGPDEWEKIKKRTYDDAREALIGKKREDIAIEEVLQKFSESVKESDQGVRVADEIVVKKGKPEDHILAQAKERGCDLIVMGSHGHGAIADVVIGSATRRVLRQSKIPVLVVPLPE